MPAPDQASSYSFRRAWPDARAVAALVHAAYRHYVARIGRTPGPMTDDYQQVIRDYHVTVAEHDAAIAGMIVLRVTEEGFLIDNVAVHPAHRGRGSAGRCLTWPRPRRSGRASALSTCTRTRR